MTRDEARAIAIEVVTKDRAMKYILHDAAEIEGWLMRPAISDADAQNIRDAGPGSIIGGEKIDLSGVASMADEAGYVGGAARQAVDAIRKSCTCPSCTAARAWREAGGHPADAPSAIRTESMLTARSILRAYLLDSISTGGMQYTTESADRAIMAILRAINE